MAANKPKHILDGIKVLDITNVIAGPSVGNQLIELGAEVIKVELSPTGDRARFIDPIKPGRGTTFVKHNRGKKSLLLDLKQPAAQAIVKELLPQIDVFIENFAPGAIARMGLGYDAVKAINPRIIMCSISAFGQTGPLAHAPGYDYIGAAYAGVLDVLGGEPDAAPTMPGVAIGDVMASVHGVAAIGYALYHRERTGVGQYLDISLLDSYFYVHDRGTIRHKLSGGKFRQKRRAPRIDDDVPLRPELHSMQAEGLAEPAFDAVADHGSAQCPRRSKAQPRAALALRVASQTKRCEQGTRNADAFVIDRSIVGGAQDPGR